MAESEYQLIGKPIYTRTLGVQALYGPYASMDLCIEKLKGQEVYANLIKGIKVAISNNNGFSEYIVNADVLENDLDNLNESHLTKIFPIDEATQQKAGLLSATDKQHLDNFIEIVEAGAGFVNENMQVVGATGGGSSSEAVTALNAKLNRVIAILGPLYDNSDSTGNSDGKFEITD